MPNRHKLWFFRWDVSYVQNRGVDRHAVLLALLFFEGFVAGTTFQHGGGEGKGYVLHQQSHWIRLCHKDSPSIEDFPYHMDQVFHAWLRYGGDVNSMVEGPAVLVNDDGWYSLTVGMIVE